MVPDQAHPVSAGAECGHAVEGVWHDSTYHLFTRSAQESCSKPARHRNDSIELSAREQRPISAIPLLGRGQRAAVAK
jgi:hypothetical protein